MVTAYIAIGSNIEPEANIRAAVRLIKTGVRVSAVSTFYRTRPIGSPDSPPFINGVIGVETDVPPRSLKFDLLRKIEDQLGRVRTSDKYAPRTLDLDIIVYGDQVVSEPDITIPDPDLFSRAFIAAPLAEIDPDLVVPGSGRRISDVAASIRDDSMLPLDDLTAALRREVNDES